MVVLPLVNAPQPRGVLTHQPVKVERLSRVYLAQILPRWPVERTSGVCAICSPSAQNATYTVTLLRSVSRLLTKQARQAQLEGHVTCQGRVWTLSFDFCVHTRCPNTRLALLTSPLAPIRQVTLLTITGVHVGV